MSMKTDRQRVDELKHDVELWKKVVVDLTREKYRALAEVDELRDRLYVYGVQLDAMRGSTGEVEENDVRVVEGVVSERFQPIDGKCVEIAYHGDLEPGTPVKVLVPIEEKP